MKKNWCFHLLIVTVCVSAMSFDDQLLKEFFKAAATVAAKDLVELVLKANESDNSKEKKQNSPSTKKELKRKKWGKKEVQKRK